MLRRRGDRLKRTPNAEVDRLSSALDLHDALCEIAAELGRPRFRNYAIVVPGRFGNMQFDYPMHVRKHYPGEIVARLARCGFAFYPRSRADRASRAKRARHAARPNGRGKGR